MEEAYVVKDNENRYWCFDLGSRYLRDWCYSLFEAKFYYNEDDAKEQARKIRDAYIPCKVVKVKIKECD